MALQTSGQMTLGDIAVELGKSRTAHIGLLDADVRGLAGKASGQVRMPADFYGKASQLSATIVVAEGNYVIDAKTGISSQGFGPVIAGGNYGSVSPSTFRGITIKQMSFSIGPNFTFKIAGSLPKNYFDRIHLGSAYGWLNSSQSLHNTANGETTWTWTYGEAGWNNATTWDGTGTTNVVIEYS